MVCDGLFPGFKITCAKSKPPPVSRREIDSPPVRRYDERKFTAHMEATVARSKNQLKKIAVAVGRAVGRAEARARRAKKVAEKARKQAKARIQQAKKTAEKARKRIRKTAKKVRRQWKRR